MPRYDAMLSADLVSEDVDRDVAVLVAAIGIDVPGPRSVLEPPGHGVRVIWARVGRSRASSPTLLEFIGLRSPSRDPDFMHARVGAQGRRPVRTHATVLTSSDLSDVIRHVRGSGVRHRVSPPTETFPFPRLWFGVSPEQPAQYEPSTDAGLWLEVIPTEAAGVSLDAIPTIARSKVGTGRIDRIARRRFVVSDLATALSKLEDCLGLVPTETWSTQSFRGARFSFGIETSAHMEVVEALDDRTELGSFSAKWGEGPHAIVFAVNGLDAFGEQLTRRGTAFSVVPSDSLASRRLTVDLSWSCRVPLEFVEDDDTHPI